MQKIVPNIWSNGRAREMAEWYTQIFTNSRITGCSTYPESVEDGLADFQLELAGKDLTVDCQIEGYEFTIINAGPEFTPTPANSFMINYDPKYRENARNDLETTWAQLIEGGKALMPLQKYDFSELYGWVEDKYGVSWQLILSDASGDDRPVVIPALMFGGPVQNQAAQAGEFYRDVFKNSREGMTYAYPSESGPASTDSIMFSDFVLEDQWFTANDAGADQDFTFSEAVSYVVQCKDQAEIDYYWEKLSAVPEAEQCGWCKDKFGVSWQICPENMGELMAKPGAYQTMMSQHKIIIGDY